MRLPSTFRSHHASSSRGRSRPTTIAGYGAAKSADRTEETPIVPRALIGRRYDRFEPDLRPLSKPEQDKKMYFCNKDGTFIAARFEHLKEIPLIIQTKIAVIYWDSYAMVQTFRGKKQCDVGDWIVVDGHGDAEVFHDDEFTAKFRPVGE
jgi:hypothetical protein